MIPAPLTGNEKVVVSNKPPIWQHKTIESKNHLTFEGAANELGAEGWELVNTQALEGRTEVIGYFKRLKPAE